MYVERMKNQTKLSDSNFFPFFQARQKLIDYDTNQFWWMDQVLEHWTVMGAAVLRLDAPKAWKIQIYRSLRFVLR